MSQVTCNICGRNWDSRAMQVCSGCNSYICNDCFADHRQGCDNFDEGKPNEM